MSAYKNILITKKAETCHISLNNPKKLNALSTTTLKEISKACDEISLNKRIKIVVISSTSKNFSAGAVCLSLVSEVYQEEDYIRQYDDFKLFVGA